MELLAGLQEVLAPGPVLCPQLVPQHPGVLVTLPAAPPLGGSQTESSLLSLGTFGPPKLLPHDLETQSEESYLYQL